MLQVHSANFVGEFCVLELIMAGQHGQQQLWTSQPS